MNNPDYKARQKYYNTARWRKERKAYLSVNSVCVRCGRAASVVDHKEGHGTNWRATFWLKHLWQSLCRNCHSSKTVLEDGAMHGRGIVPKLGGLKRKDGDDSPITFGPSHAPKEKNKTFSERSALAISLITRLKQKGNTE